jgi:hypothetical protein
MLNVSEDSRTFVVMAKQSEKNCYMEKSVVFIDTVVAGCGWAERVANKYVEVGGGAIGY